MKAIIFDLDQTLVDFANMKVKCCEAAMAAMVKAGLKMNKTKAMQYLFKLYTEHGWEDQTIFQKFLKKYHGKVDYSIMAPAIVAYRRAKRLKTYPEVKPTLKKLKKRGYKLAILSDAAKIQAWTRMAAIGLHKGYFDHVITANDLKKRKPDPEPFKVLMKRMKTRPEDTYMVGDMIGRDLVPAKKLGVTTIFAEYGVPIKYAKRYKITTYHTPGKPDHTIKKFSELLKILK